LNSLFEQDSSVSRVEKHPFQEESHSFAAETECPSLVLLEFSVANSTADDRERCVAMASIAFARMGAELNDTEKKECVTHD
jgi:hypothetical protein